MSHIAGSRRQPFRRRWRSALGESCWRSSLRQRRTSRRREMSACGMWTNERRPTRCPRPARRANWPSARMAAALRLRCRGGMDGGHPGQKKPRRDLGHGDAEETADHPEGGNAGGRSHGRPRRVAAAPASAGLDRLAAERARIQPRRDAPGRRVAGAEGRCAGASRHYKKRRRPRPGSGGKGQGHGPGAADFQRGRPAIDLFRERLAGSRLGRGHGRRAIHREGARHNAGRRIHRRRASVDGGPRGNGEGMGRADAAAPAAEPEREQQLFAAGRRVHAERFAVGAGLRHRGRGQKVIGDPRMGQARRRLRPHEAPIYTEQDSAPRFQQGRDASRGRLRGAGHQRG